MIAVEEAIQLVKHHTKPLDVEVVMDIEKSGGHVLYNNVYSPMDMPPFRQSAMDGYALCLHEGLNYTVVGEIRAGDGHHTTLKAGEAVRIYTGAAVPDMADAVMQQEKVKVNGSTIKLENSASFQLNIRPLGEQVKKGELALKKGTKLTAAAVGYLSSLGIQKVSVHKKPSIAIVATGNELVEASQDLQHGKIYESNSKMLQYALHELKFYSISVHKVEDDFRKMTAQLTEVVKQNNLVIVSGGISVGDYDFVGKALEKLQTKSLFYKVRQKPGKPLFFGEKDGTFIFALPGNPAAALTCFYVYIHIALQKMMGNINLELPRVMAKSLSEYKKRGDKAQFLKALYNDGEVSVLEGQGSAMLHSFSVSNALVLVPEDISEIKIGDEVKVILLPI